MADGKQQRMDAILGRALRDKEFRQKLIDNPAEAAAEEHLSPDELELISGGMALGSSLLGRNVTRIAFCTEKTCNEKGGARVSIDNPAVEPLPGEIGESLPGEAPGT